MTDLNLKFKTKKEVLAFADQLDAEVEIKKFGTYYMAKFYDISDHLASYCHAFVINSGSNYFDRQDFLRSPYSIAMPRG